MSIAISDVGKASALTSILQNNQTQLTNLSEQLSSGQQSQSLSGYGGQGQQLLDLDSSLAAANAYVASTTTTSTFLQGTDDGLTELTSDANQLSHALTGLSGSNSTTSTASLAALVNGLELDVTTTLNTQVGNRYIFSGTRYDTAPVQSISALPTPTSPTAFTAVAAPALPAYDSAAPGSDPAASAQPTVTIAPGETISYGVSSNDPAIQQLVYALQNAAAAVTATGSDQSQYVSLALNAVQQATTGLQAAQATNADQINQVTATQTAQQQSVTTLTNMLDGIQGVNTTSLSVEISNLQTQMDASYKITSSLLGMSLANYLSTSSTG